MPTSSTDHEIRLVMDVIEKIGQITKKKQSNIDFKQINYMIENEMEFKISILIGIWLIRFFNDFKNLESSSEILEIINKLKNDYPKSISIWNFLELLFEYLREKNLLELVFKIELPKLDNILIADVLGTMLQKSLTPKNRRKLAVNYTTFSSANVLVSILERNNFSTIVDPFCGSGRLISTYLSKLDSDLTFPRIRINDIMASAVLLAYCRIILILSKLKKDLNLLHASIGDAFRLFFTHNENTSELENYDLVIMNPPFTRIHRIENTQKSHLNALEEQYKHYISGQVGLHVFSIFLADSFLKKGGLIALILPAATILSKYSKGVQNLLLKRYEINSIAASDNNKSCSEDSNLREIYLTAKRVKKPKKPKISFLRISNAKNSSNWNILSKKVISSTLLSKEWNWTIFLREPRLFSLRKKILQTKIVKSGKELEMDIIRGVEIYGPDFFFIPNQNWGILSKENDDLIIINRHSEDKKITIAIPENYLKRILRRPGKYNHIISPSVTDFAISIPNSFTFTENWLKKYYSVSERLAAPAKKKFGLKWISHIDHQLKNKMPYGHLFLIDKSGITTTSVMSHFLDEKLPCTKNFYLLRTRSIEEAKLLAAWLNSTFFIILFLMCRREIGGSYGRLQIMDYMEESLFLDLSKISQEVKEKIIFEFEEIRNKKLPAIPYQIDRKIKKDLDFAIAKSLNFSEKDSEDLLSEMYSILEDVFKILNSRDKKNN